MTTLDLTARYATGLGAGILADLEFILSVSNAFDVAPDLVRTDYDYYPPYDSTNYSAIGRVISLSVRKKW
jgi:outer membrane receptor protein involved in Fe transport